MAIKRFGKELKPREQAAYVRELTGWTKKQYQNEYDKLRNRARNYERATGARSGTFNVADLLARNAVREYRAARYGEKYTPTALYSAISQTTSATTSAKRKPTPRATGLIREQAFAALKQQFHGLIENSKFSKDIARERAKLKRAGKLTPETYRKLLERYGDLSTAARRSIEAHNKLVGARDGKLTEYREPES